MRITGPIVPIQTLLAGALPKVARFAVAEAATPQGTAPAPIAVSVSVEMMVALAASERPAESRRRAALVADRGLRALERLDTALMAGLPAVESLHEIAAWSEALGEPEDAELRELFKDIELRIRVELAKHDIIA